MVHLCTITWKRKWSVYLTHIILKYRRCQAEIRTCLTAIQAGVAVSKNGCHNVIFSNWLKEKFQILLDIQKGKLLHNFAKAPFYTLANCTHSSVEGSLLRCEIDVLNGVMRHHEVGKQDHHIHNIVHQEGLRVQSAYHLHAEEINHGVFPHMDPGDLQQYHLVP